MKHKKILEIGQGGNASVMGSKKTSVKPLQLKKNMTERSLPRMQTEEGSMVSLKSDKSRFFNTRRNNAPNPADTARTFGNSSVERQTHFKPASTSREYGFPSIEKYSSMMNTGQSNFFQELDTDPEALKRFHASQVSMDKLIAQNKKKPYNKVHNIVNRTRYTDQATTSRMFFAPNKQNKLPNIEQTNVMNFQIAIEEQNNLNLKNLEKKCSDLVEELNVITDSVNRKEAVLNKLKETRDRIKQHDSDMTQKLGAQLEEVKDTTSQVESRLKKEKEAETRLSRIIEVCQVNSYENQCAFRSLDTFSKNLDKVLQEQNAIIKKQLKVAEKREHLASELSSQIVPNNNSNASVLDMLSTLQNERVNLQNQFKATNSLIEEAAKNAKLNLNEMTERKLASIAEEEKEEEIANKNTKMREELAIRRDNFEKYGEMLKETPLGVPWDEKPEIKKLVKNLNEMKDLKRELLQKQFEMNEMKRKNGQTQKKINSARDFSVAAQEDPKYLDMRRQEVESRLHMLNEKIAQELGEGKALKKIPLEDNLRVVSIASNIGLQMTDVNPKSVLLDVDSLELIKDHLKAFKKRAEELLSEAEQESLLSGSKEIYSNMLIRGDVELKMSPQKSEIKEMSQSNKKITRFSQSEKRSSYHRELTLNSKR